MSERSCPNCAQTVRDTAVYCPHCGAPQPDPVPLTTTGLVTPEPVMGTPWRAREALWLFLVHLLVTAVVIGVFAVTDMDEDALTVVGIITSEILLIVFTLGWVSVRYGAGPATLGLRKLTPANIGIGIGAGIGGLVAAGVTSALLISILEQLQGTPVSQPEQIELSADPTGAVLVLLGISVVILAPLAEEIFFRGFLYQGLRRWMALWPALLFSAAIFAVTHVFPLVMPPIFVLGILLAFLVERRDSIWPAIIAHMTFNAVGFWIMFVAEPASAAMR